MRSLLSVVVLSAIFLAACSSSSSSPSTGASAPTSSGGLGAAVTPTAAPANRPAGAAATAAPTQVAARAAEAKADDGRTTNVAAAPPAPAAAQRPAGAPAPAAPAAQPVRPVPPPAPTPGQPAQPAPVPPAQAGRMVIYTTEIALLVTSPSQLVSSLGDIATQSGGYIAGVENKDEAGTPVTTIRMKIPPERYEPTMRQLRSLAVEVTSEKATTQDVTEEYSDVQTQLAALEASHAQLLELMGRAQNVDEILKIQEKLAQTKTQIDRLKGRQTFLQRNTEFANVTVVARPADDVLARTYSSLRTSLRRAETTRAQTVAAIQRARTPEDEATLRDRLGEVTLEIERLNTRIGDVQAKALAANITLPAPPQDDAVTATTDQELVNEYLRLVGERRAAEAERDRLTREQRARPTPEVSEQLRQAILRVTTLDTQVKATEERARRGGVTLPSLSSEQIAALAGLPPESWFSKVDATWASLGILSALIVAGLGVFVGRRLRGRRSGAAPSAA